MGRRVKQAILVLVVVFAAAQFVRPDRTNPPIDPGHAIQAYAETTNALAAVLDRACRDCHSNGTVWPWYTQVAPVSWLMAYGVASGRDAVNFSEWAGYSPAQRKRLLAASCDDATNGRMPGLYTLLRPDTRLSSGDVETICAAAHLADTHLAGASR